MFWLRMKINSLLYALGFNVYVRSWPQAFLGALRFVVLAVLLGYAVGKVDQAAHSSAIDRPLAPKGRL